MERYDLDSQDTFLISQKAVVRSGGMVLALGRKVAGAVLWELPGGLLEMGESLRDGLTREVLEETGIAVSVGRLLCVWDHRIGGFMFRDGRVLSARVVELAFDCGATTSEVTLSPEHDTYRWLEPSETMACVLPCSPENG